MNARKNGRVCFALDLGQDRPAFNAYTTASRDETLRVEILRTTLTVTHGASRPARIGVRHRTHDVVGRVVAPAMPGHTDVQRSPSRRTPSVISRRAHA